MKTRKKGNKKAFAADSGNSAFFLRNSLYIFLYIFRMHVADVSLRDLRRLTYA